MKQINDILEFLKNVKPPVQFEILECEDTHFARLHLRLTAYNSSQIPLYFLIGGFQNFVSDIVGRSASLAKAKDFGKNLIIELERKNIQIENNFSVVSRGF